MSLQKTYSAQVIQFLTASVSVHLYCKHVYIYTEQFCVVHLFEQHFICIYERTDQRKTSQKQAYFCTSQASPALCNECISLSRQRCIFSLSIDLFRDRLSVSLSDRCVFSSKMSCRVLTHVFQQPWRPLLALPVTSVIC